jgi:hypothetical protein
MFNLNILSPVRVISFCEGGSASACVECWYDEGSDRCCHGGCASCSIA